MLCPTAYTTNIEVAWLEGGMARCMGPAMQMACCGNIFRRCLAHAVLRPWSAIGDSVLVGHEDCKPTVGHKRIPCAHRTPSKPSPHTDQASLGPTQMGNQLGKPQLGVCPSAGQASAGRLSFRWASLSLGFPGP